MPTRPRPAGIDNTNQGTNPASPAGPALNVSQGNQIAFVFRAPAGGGPALQRATLLLDYFRTRSADALQVWLVEADVASGAPALNTARPLLALAPNTPNAPGSPYASFQLMHPLSPGGTCALLLTAGTATGGSGLLFPSVVPSAPPTPASL